MAHGGFGKRRRVAGRPSFSGGGSSGGRGSGDSGGGGGGGERNREKGGRLHAAAAGKKESEKKSKIVSIKNQIRSIERLLKKPLLSEVKDAQEKRLESLKKQAELHARCELERKMALRYRRVKFFERRKIERRIRRLEKQQRSSMGGGDEIVGTGGGGGGGAAAAAAANSSGAALTQQLAQLAEDLEYVRFFPKTEKYVSLFMGNDDETVMAKRQDLRVKIKANLAAAVAAGVDLEETGSEDDAMALSEDDFFMAGSSNDDADADDELTDKSPKWGGEEKDEMSRETIPPPVSRITAASVRPSPWKGGDRTPNGTGGVGVASIHSKDRRQQKSSRAFLPPPPRVKSRGLANKAVSGTGGGGGVKGWNAAAGPGSSGRRVTKKLRLQAGKSSRAQLPAAHGTSEENPRHRAWTSSSHSSEVIKGSSTSDAPQQQPPKKRKRTRPKKKK